MEGFVIMILVMFTIRAISTLVFGIDEDAEVDD